MTSKEFIEWQMLGCSYNQKKYYNQVLKDLEKLELLEAESKLEKEKVKYVMEQLKKQDRLLTILKKCDDDIQSLFYVYVLNAVAKKKISIMQANEVKEWLKNDK